MVCKLASNPVDATQAYEGKAADFGTSKDPLVGIRIGGINVFGEASRSTEAV
jgi:hypothetical protein